LLPYFVGSSNFVPVLQVTLFPTRGERPSVSFPVRPRW
jgi:hypothetical protein